MTQTVDVWGGAWGASWGGFWGYGVTPQQTGGGSGKSSVKKRGWANERAIHEASLAPMIHAQKALRKAKDPQANRVASVINRYDIGGIDLDTLRTENELLKARLKIKNEYSQTLQEAQEIMAAFIEDEQEALDLLMADFEMDVSVILQQP